MKQDDIDRYNKGQSKCKGRFICDDIILDCGLKTIIISLYDFLFDPKYGWREMFDKDPDYQKEFWEWIVKTKRGRVLNVGGKKKKCLYDLDGDMVMPTPEMLDGPIKKFMQERMK